MEVRINRVRINRARPVHDTCEFHFTVLSVPLMPNLQREILTFYCLNNLRALCQTSLKAISWQLRIQDLFIVGRLGGRGIASTFLGGRGCHISTNVYFTDFF